MLKLFALSMLVIQFQPIVAMEEPEDTVEDIRNMGPADLQGYMKEVLNYAKTITNIGDQQDYLKEVNQKLRAAGKLQESGFTYLKLTGFNTLASGDRGNAIQAAVTKINELIGSPDESILLTGLGENEALAKKQKEIMQTVVTEANFDEMNLQKSSTASSKLAAAGAGVKNLNQKTKSENIDKLLMTAFCALANNEGGAAAGSTNAVDEVNKALGTALPANTTASEMLELAVRAPLRKS
jgi:hypothetical protein